MKKWVEAGLTELSIEETAHQILGNSLDGGYVGDGHIGVLEFDCGGGSGSGSGSGSNSNESNGEENFS